MKVSGQLHTSAALTPGKSPNTHWIGEWVDPRAGLDAVAKRKSRLYRGDISVMSLICMEKNRAVQCKMLVSVIRGVIGSTLARVNNCLSAMSLTERCLQFDRSVAGSAEFGCVFLEQLLVVHLVKQFPVVKTETFLRRPPLDYCSHLLLPLFGYFTTLCIGPVHLLVEGFSGVDAVAPFTIDFCKNRFSYCSPKSPK